ncbi:MAG: hypothetical protein KIS78_16170 [Labilithrix sp.]|nr:hypothetical protein [Labilithrix sp.]
MPVTGDVAAALEKELVRELPSGHPLHGRSVRAVARRDDRDDVAYEVDGGKLCVVHLTYRAETDPRWPSSVFVDSLEDEDGV